jgi:aspartyl-tRNA(Asn)/glutamyl-tRNA(Gln) amidotransferase subunit C
MELSRDDVRHVAKLARIGLREDELDRYLDDLRGILDHIGRIAELDLSGVPATSHPLDVENVLADDEPRPSWPREQLLALAPDHTDDGFRVPPIGAEPELDGPGGSA